jgi:hypothetical protein
MDPSAPPQQPTVAGYKAKLLRNGTAIAPAQAPAAIKKLIVAANRIAKLPYRYGGGHASFTDTGYDCSGSVSYALRGGKLLKSPLDSSGFMKWGQAGLGKWITIYSNPGHAYMVVAGLRFDTSGRSATGSRWQKATRSSKGFVVRHPVGY